MAGTDQGMLDALESRHLRPKEERRKAGLKWLAIGERSTPPTGYRGLYEQPIPSEPEDVGICCSGGGIRSAAFNLGALQKLQAENILQRSKYLSAVSGGSYIAAAFCMIAETWPTQDDLNDSQVQERLDAEDLATGVEDSDNSDPKLVTDDAPPFEEGSPEEQYLRNHLGYLAPDGLARVYLALRMLAGMLVNVVIVGLPVFVIGVLGGWAVSVHYGGLDEGFHFPQGVWMPVVAVAGLARARAARDPAAAQMGLDSSLPRDLAGADVPARLRGRRDSHRRALGRSRGVRLGQRETGDAAAPVTM